MKRKNGLGWTVGLALLLCACGQISENEEREESVSLSVESGALESETLESEALESAPSETAAAGAEASAAQEEEWWRTCFDGMSYSKSYKGIADTNPIMTQHFGADPYAMVYGDRMYFYMTADAPEYDAAGEIQENTYGKIQSLNVVSTDDMVNFTDHGSIQAAGRSGEMGRQFLGTRSRVEEYRRKGYILSLLRGQRRRYRCIDVGQPDGTFYGSAR